VSHTPFGYRIENEKAVIDIEAVHPFLNTLVPVCRLHQLFIYNFVENLDYIQWTD
jgi:hypothetical protein